MGIDVAGGQATLPVALAPAGPGEAALQARRGPGSADTPLSVAGVRDDLPVLTRRVIAATGAVPLLRDARGAMLAGWRASGRGRVGLWTVDDSFALVTSGHGDRYDEWWSATASALARPDGRLAVRIEGLPRAGERMAVCDLPAAGAVMVDPAGRRATLLPDPAAGGCAGYWPTTAGWHRVAARQGGRTVYVQPAAALPSVRARERAEGTLALAGAAAAQAAGGATDGARGSPWPWFAGWLVAVAGLWWLERAKTGRRAGQ
jgi:hypothetical protein